MENTFEHMTIPLTTITSGKGQSVTPDLYCLPIQFVNVIFIGDPSSKDWVLVDAGVPNSADKIISEAEERFGSNHSPKALILTHGHFDHVGSIIELIKYWNVPVYAHELEIPYLTGKTDYPPGDPTVDGGLLSELSPLFPNHGTDLGSHVKPLASDGSIAALPEWRWIHTPGHTPGHISLFRDQDRSLIAGDAFVTVKQESLFKVITQKLEISGPPKYFTTDWDAARESVKKLQALNPSAAAAGHGLPMSGELLSQSLDKLAREFDRIAMPDHGRYVH